ncbi:MAG TPA: alpha/beta fold hydrolase [Polyangiaceae bacterium]|jgi:pimeloyl-ACP methyl ester carboxylesterase|nr:alpha/beta fold hydrolase [Polyangiaceae bacterium]
MSRRDAQPFWIETKAGAIFAWHNAPPGAAREAGIVLCRPFGYDAQCSQRAYRHLAERLSDAGFHVLRLDYHGAGDSSGGDSDDDRWMAWMDSVRAGMSFLRKDFGVGKIALFGSRFGALVALGTAGEDDVDALVLMAPPASGRTWLREARALQSLVDASGGVTTDAASDGREESAGFLMTAPTVAVIAKFDPTAVEQTARAVLVIARDDVPGAEEKLVTKLRARGVDATLSRTPGYGAMMQQDPQRSVVPDAAWNEITAWLVARYSRWIEIPETHGGYPTVATVRENLTAPAVREEIVDIDGLFGVITEPTQPPAGTLPVIVLHNIGVNSHIGANRMYVGMARRWAGLGFRVLRFDTTGLGDSPSTERLPENRVYSQVAIQDSRRVMDFLERKRSASRFVLMGLCSGAYVSFHSSVADDRVAGIVLMNVPLFHWKEGDPVDFRKRDVVKATSFYSKAVFDRDVWVRLVQGDVNVSTIAQGLLQKSWERARHRVSSLLSGESDVARGFRALLGRSTNVFLVFSADDGGRDVIDAHLGTNGDRLRRERGFRLEVIDGTDHTFSPLWSQEVLLSLLTSHLMSHFLADRSLGPSYRDVVSLESLAQ